MGISQVDRRRLVGAVAAGFGAAQGAEGAVVHQELNPPAEVAVGMSPAVDLGADGVNEFVGSWAFTGNFVSVGTKATDFAGTTFGDPPQTRPGMAAIIIENEHAANLAAGTAIGPADAFVTPPVLTRLSGWNDPDQQQPIGNFNGTSGYIGVQFELNGNTHYGYVGFEGDPPDQHSGRIFEIGWEDEPNTAVRAGNVSPGLTADFDADGDADGQDLLIWQRGLGLSGQTDNSNGDANASGTVDSADLDLWKSQFGEVLEEGVSVVPEPTSLSLLAAGAAGLAAYRRRRQAK